MNNRFISYISFFTQQACLGLLLLAASATICAQAQEGELVISTAPLASPGDSRNDWRNMLLVLALEKTRSDFGDYRIKKVPQMSRARLWKSLQSNRYPNLVFALAYKKAHAEKSGITYIPFPVELGFLGYRVCFHPQSRQAKIHQAIAEGRVKELTHGLQKDWEDGDILRYNGYQVVKISEYESLFRMTAVGRFDLFCRGISEIYDEYQRYSDVEGLGLDKTIAFHYQMPVFYFSNSENKQAITRIQTGLIRAHQDGSLTKMFEKHYKERIDFTQLESRQVFELENPLISGLDAAYQVYNYKP